jgi:amidase
MTAVGPRPPHIEEILALADEFGLEMDVDEAAEYQAVMGGAFRTYQALDRLSEPRPAVAYPRTPGTRPAPEDNPYNAWYWRTDIKGRPDGPLAGERVGVKDSIAVAGVPMANGSRTLDGFVPDVDATVITRLLDAGATIAGKTTASDLCGVAGGHDHPFGTVRNPHDPTRSPGGSSCGSGVAIAAGDISMALGGDQGGSIRIPAAWCGTVGMKATFGLVPYTGCMGMETSLDHVGPMSDTVSNCARLMAAIAGPDPLDPRAAGVPADAVSDYVGAVDQGVDGLTIGVLKEGFGHSEWPTLGFGASDPVVDDRVRDTVAALEAAGAKVVEVSVPEHVDAAHVLVALLEEGVCANMLRGNAAGHGWQGFYDTRLLDTFARGWRQQAADLPPPIKAILLVGEHMHRNYHGHYYAKAQNLRPVMRAAYDRALQQCDALVMPTLPFRASKLPAPDAPIPERMTIALNMIGNVCQANVTGQPAISVPCAMADGLPIGLQFMGRHFEEATLLRLAAAVERAGDWRAR